MGTNFQSVLLHAFLLFILTIIIGLIPFYLIKKTVFKHDQYMMILSLFSIGMLLGTSFMLVIPEGMKLCLENGGNVGLNLLLGFLIIHLFDQIIHWIKTSKTIQYWNYNYNECRLQEVKDLFNPKKTIGLVLKNNLIFSMSIHAFSDGLTLGASLSDNSLKIIMLITIMIHKIPAVLTLSSLMITKQKLETLEIISNLIIFSALMPIGYIIISLFNLNDSDTIGWFSANILLFSGGCLLYSSFAAFMGGDNIFHDVDMDYHTITSSSSTSKPSDFIHNEHESINLEYNLPYNNIIYIFAGISIPATISFFITEN